jgi:hypothetical protein
MAENSLQGEIICFIFPSVNKVKSSGIGSIMKKIQSLILDIAVCGRNHASEDRISLIVILLKPEPEIVRHRLNDLYSSPYILYRLSNLKKG